MEAIKKQASKLREQVAKQQQAILRQLGQLGHEAIMVDEAELHCHQQLEKLYRSTRTAKHFQRDLVHGVDGFISTNKKQMDIARRLAEDCCKYAIENQSSASSLSTAVSDFGTSHASMEDHRETMLGILGRQVCEPLRASIKSAPLEDARHLTHSYDRVRQEFEAQAAEVMRRQSKFRDSSPENLLKLKSAETRLSELKSSMSVLGREATAAMLSVEDHQQQFTCQKLLTMVDAERSYHQHVLTILEKLHSEMILKEQLNESALQSSILQEDVHLPSTQENTASNQSNDHNDEECSDSLFVARVIHSFDAQADGELSLEIDDYIIVRQVAPNGWSEGECKGNAGWFPSAYIEKADKAPTSKLSEEDSHP